MTDPISTGVGIPAAPPERFWVIMGTAGPRLWWHGLRSAHDAETVHEYRLVAQPHTANGGHSEGDRLREALIEQEAIDLIVDLCGPGASQSGTNCRVVEDHFKQFARRLAALTETAK